MRHHALLVCTSASLLLLASCARPDPQVEDLRRQVAGLEAKIAGIEQQRSAEHKPTASAHEAGDPRQEPQTALNLLVSGNAAFASGHGRAPDLGTGRRDELTKGQKPYVALIGCADSRVPPEHIFNAGLGDVFVVRSAGNIADEMAVASTEYAVAHLGTRLILVLGHSSCGAVKAACAGAHDTPAVTALVERIQPAVREAQKAGAVGTELPGKAVVCNAALQKRELLEHSALLRGLNEEHQIRVLVASYQLDTGSITWLDTDGLDSTAAAPAQIQQTVQPTTPHNTVPVEIPPGPAPRPPAKAPAPASHH